VHIDCTCIRVKCGTWQGNLADHKGPKKKSKQIIFEDGKSKQEGMKKEKLEEEKVKKEEKVEKVEEEKVKGGKKKEKVEEAKVKEETK
jgi:hypothetical protein